MKSNKIKYSLIAVGVGVAVLCIVSIRAQAQHLQIDNTQIHDGKIVLSYHITDTTVGKYYTVRLYSSHDNFMQALEKVSGDAGISIRPGLNRTLTWDPKELGANFNGKVALEIRARVYVPFVKLEGIREGTKVKRLKPYTLSWSGGSPQNILNIDLLRNGEKQATFANIANVGYYSMLLPKDIRPGRYVMRVSDSKNKDEVVISDGFRVRRKYPLLLKATAPLLLVGGLTAWLLQPKSRIPDPIEPSK